MSSLPEWHAVRRDILESFRKWEQKARTSKKEWKWQRGIVAHPLSEANGTRGHFSMKKSESACQQRASRVMLLSTTPCVATLVSGEHVVGQWCSWIMMKRWGPLHGLCGSLEAEFEVQRTIKRAELTAGNKGIIVG